MQDQPKYKPLAESRFFADGRASRPIPAGTIARDEWADNEAYHTGESNGQFLEAIPVPVTLDLLHRGRDRFEIFCSPCHARSGDGNGMVAQRGLRAPANLHTDRLRAVPPGYIFQVITNGYGAMGDYDDQVPVDDRWAIVAYIRALQLSRDATMNDVPPEARAQLVSSNRQLGGTQ
jgi:mono/diheme cytochrome c family protein